MVNKKTWSPQPQALKPPPYTVEASGSTAIEGETIPRRNVLAKDALSLQPEEGIATIYDILRRSSRKFGNAKAMGSRKLLKTHTETKKIQKTVNGKQQTIDKKWTYSELSDYQYVSFIEFERMAIQIGAGLRQLGMSRDDRIEIFAATTVHWLAIAHGASTQSMPIVTAYDTLGEEGLEHSLRQTHAKAIFLDAHLLSKLVKPLQEAKDVQHIIYNDEGDLGHADIQKIKTTYPHVSLQSFNELKSMGKNNPVEAVPPQSDDLCCIMYTSGSTGTPKGVLLKHKNVVAAIAGVDVIVGQYLGPGDGLLAYLPLAHILEFVFENACLYWGGTLGYGNPKTLSDISVRNCNGDLREFRPTVMVGVPAVWESVKKGIISKVESSNVVAKNMFWAALSAKSVLLSTGLPGANVLDNVVFSKVKEATGGKLRICMNGGGPIAKETLRFLSMSIAPMISGYGLTETSGMGSLNDPAAWTDATLGEIPASVELKLVDATELGYSTNKNPPQGEVWIRGAAVTEGYLDLENENKEAFTEDGWFKTGDIGEFDSSGQLKIIDRKKNLVKTLNGEYIALEKLESIYRSCRVVANICVYAAQDRVKPIAIIVPVEAALNSLASQHGISGKGLEELAWNKDLCSVVLKEMQSTGRTGGLGGIEIIDGVVMADQEWNPQNGLTTSAQKINRKGILKRWQKEVDEAYSKSS